MDKKSIIKSNSIRNFINKITRLGDSYLKIRNEHKIIKMCQKLPKKCFKFIKWVQFDIMKFSKMCGYLRSKYSTLIVAIKAFLLQFQPELEFPHFIYFYGKDDRTYLLRI